MCIPQILMLSADLFCALLVSTFQNYFKTVNDKMFNGLSMPKDNDAVADADEDSCLFSISVYTSAACTINQRLVGEFVPPLARSLSCAGYLARVVCLFALFMPLFLHFLLRPAQSFVN